MTGPPASPPPDGELPRRRRGEALRAARPASPSLPARPSQPPAPPQQPATPGRPATGGTRRAALPAAGNRPGQGEPTVSATRPPTDGWPGETGQFARPEWFMPPASEPRESPSEAETVEAPQAEAGAESAHRAARPAAPTWRRALTRVVNLVLGLALLGAAVFVQTLILGKDDLDAPLTSNGAFGETARTAFFDARVEGVEVAKALQQKDRDRVQATPGQVFVVVKLGATATKRALRLRSAHLLTADGLRFAATERLEAGASLSDKWVQPLWWGSGLYVFEVPPSALPGSRLVVSEDAQSLFGDQYLPEASLDLGLDAAKARTAVDSARDVYEVPRT